MFRLRMRLILLAASLAAAFSVGASTVGTAAPALAATKGNCSAFASVTAAGRNEWKVRWAGSSSGWSPPGKLTIKTTPVIDGTTRGSQSGSKSDATSISIGPFTETVLGASASITVHVTATGPAGTVSCSKSASA
jgi:hypothetical protein